VNRSDVRFRRCFELLLRLTWAELTHPDDACLPKPVDESALMDLPARLPSRG
jgi:hypothetical protein